MNKFLKNFIKVVYYLLAIAFGVVLVITMPYIVLNSKLTKLMNEHLKNGEFVKAMDLIGCYYDSEIAYHYEKDEIQLVLFRATPFVDTVYDTTDEQGNEIKITSQETLELGYFGFLCNVKTYDVDSSNESEDFENKTKLVVNDTVQIEILDYDQSQNGKIDSILTMTKGSYVTFTVAMDDVEEIQKLEFVDKDGKTFMSTNLSTSSYGNLDFEHRFFSEFNKFIPRYNDLAKNKVLGSATEEELLKEQQDLEKIATEIITNNSGFTVGKYNDAVNSTQFNSYLYSILYFIGVFLVGDLLIGNKVTIKVIKTIFKPIVSKISKNKKTEENSAELYEYYSQVVITLNVPEGFEESVTLMLYRNDQEEKFEITKENGFIVKRRIHAGIYEKIVFTCVGYKVLDLPETLEVKGFKTELKLKVEKE